MSVFVQDVGNKVIKAKIALLLADMAMVVGLDTIERVRFLGSKMAQELDEVLFPKPGWNGSH